MSVPPDARLVPSPHVLCKELGEEIVLLDLETETYYGLNAQASRFWKLIAASATTGEALRTLLEEFDVSAEDLSRDVHALIDDLVGRGLVRIGNA